MPFAQFFLEYVSEIFGRVRQAEALLGMARLSVVRCGLEIFGSVMAWCGYVVFGKAGLGRVWYGYGSGMGGRLAAHIFSIERERIDR